MFASSVIPPVPVEIGICPSVTLLPNFSRAGRRKPEVPSLVLPALMLCVAGESDNAIQAEAELSRAFPWHRFADSRWWSYRRSKKVEQQISTSCRPGIIKPREYWSK